MAEAAGLNRTPGAAPAHAGTRLEPRRLVALALALSVCAATTWLGYDYWTRGRFVETTNDAYVGGNVTPVAAHVAAMVESVLVRDNQHVAAGQVMIRLDARDYRAAQAHARADLAARQAALTGLQAQYAGQQDMVSQQDAELAGNVARAAFSQRDAGRYDALAITAAGSRQEAERSESLDRQAKASVAAARASLNAARRKLTELDAAISQAKANIAAAEANLTLADLNLGWTEIRAPISGFVGNRVAQVGTFVPSGAYLVSVIPDEGLWVDANFKEDQIGQMKDGRAAKVVADVLPDHAFAGQVESLAPGTGGIFSVIPPENATGNFTKIVQRVPVRIRLDPRDPMLAALRPGLSVTAKVDVRGSAGDLQ